MPVIDETARLAELHSLKLLDTPAEPRFDRLTHLAADVLNAPTVLISLVDESRQWFKSAVGFAQQQTDRDSSFCAHALPVEFMEIPDTLEDQRFRTNALVTGAPYIRFYAGAVLHGPTGQPLGTLCVIDTQPRRLSSIDKQRLTAFAQLVEQEINLHCRFRVLQHDLQRAAFYDPVTGLPERILMEEHLGRTLEEAKAEKQAIAVVHIRLTNLDVLTALEGRQGADKLLQAVAQRMHTHVRPSDQIGRVGQDRFLLVLPGLSEAADAGRIRSLIDLLARSIALDRSQRRLNIAAGVSRYPDDAQTAASLVDCAYTAVCEPDGQCSLSFYAHELYADLSRRHDLAARLARALAADALTQVYQPILHCERGRVVAVEALARWHDVAYGAVSPGEFIPMVEADVGMRRALTRWSLESACRQIAGWRGQHEPSLRICVNIPGGELYCNDFADMVRATLRQYDVAADALVLELTEASLITDLESAVATINELRELGVRFAVDDFGTGYSSLNYLKQLPLDTVKIDRSFIQDITSDPVARRLTRGILDIAQALGLSVVAEGIETEAQHTVLQNLNCHYVQGFLFGRPAAASEITQRLTSR